MLLEQNQEPVGIGSVCDRLGCLAAAKKKRRAPDAEFQVRGRVHINARGLSVFQNSKPFSKAQQGPASYGISRVQGGGGTDGFGRLEAQVTEHESRHGRHRHACQNESCYHHAPNVENLRSADLSAV